MDDHPETLACPYCGNINPYTQENCMKCKKPLGLIRQAMKGVVTNTADETAQSPEPPKEIEPAPPMPELPATTNKGLGNFISSRAFLIRNMGNRADEIAARFFKQLANRNIQGLSLSFGSITINTESNKRDSRDYYFAERDLGSEALGVMAIRIAPSGTDLYIEWRNYALPPVGRIQYDWGAGCFGLIFYGLGLLYDIWYVYRMLTDPNERKKGLEGFQAQDNFAFQLSVRAALEEAIDLAGISKSFIQGVSKEGEGKDDQRLI